MILLYIFATIVVINCAYFLLFSKISFLKKTAPQTSVDFPVSLLVCAKNEAENLKEYIPLWLAQEYSKFELILINDSSTDDTLEIMESFANTDSRIQIVNVESNEAFWGNKKYALTLGIKRAKNPRLVFTDADCKPASTFWLRIMASNLTNKKQLVLGYGAYQKLPGLLNKLIRFETLMTAVQYFSFAKVGSPYMGVGRNLAYTSKLYYENNGFMNHIKVSSGDDDLFVNQASTSENTAISIHGNDFTYSVPKKTWKAWKLQKKRHFSTAQFYKLKHKTLLALYFISNFLFWTFAFIALILSDWSIALAIIGFRLLVHYIIIGKAAQKLKENDLIPFIPFLEFFLVIVQLSIFISNKAPKQASWK